MKKKERGKERKKDLYFVFSINMPHPRYFELHSCAWLGALYTERGKEYSNCTVI